ncbi:MAG: hypothetical protein KF745_14275 [Phycisphaeraceae bacterium]|nr:hypothetical protein [Phycisphaeraceae bacterium]
MAQSPRSRSQRHYQKDLEWARALQSAIERYFFDSTRPDRALPRAQVISVSPSGNRFELELRFQSGTTYCCAEPGCFLPTFCRSWWKQLRETLLELSDRDPPPLSLVLHGVVEHGACLQDRQVFGLPVKSRAYTYKHGPLRERNAK